ncbi:MAG: N-acetyltransferase [Hyphomicrobiaceae bacterium]
MTSPAPAVVTRPAVPDDLPAMAALQSRAFSPGRFTRTAYRVREGGPEQSPFCRVALIGDRLVAALRMTSITIGGEKGALLLGPLAVDPQEAGRGYGRRLVAESLDAAREQGSKLVVLVGDTAYYGRFGFGPVPPGQIRLPGPVDPARLLAAELRPDVLATFRGLVARAA